MPKRILRDAKLDRQLGQYLKEPLTLTDITEYTIARDSRGITKATVTFYVDMERFEKEALPLAVVGEQGPELIDPSKLKYLGQTTYGNDPEEKG